MNNLTRANYQSIFFKNLSFLFLFLFCTSSLIRAQEKYTLGVNDVEVDGSGVITECKIGFTTNKNIIIPEKIDGKTIIGIADKTYSENGVFHNKGLASVTFSKNSELATIGNGAFNVNSLIFLELPASLTTIGDGAFSSNQLKSVILPANLTTIGNYAFSYNFITILKLPDKLTTFGDGAFSYNRLPSLNLPASLTTIGESAFRGNLLATVIFPANLTTIGESAFRDNYLTSVTFPAGLTTIGEYAFLSNALTEVTFKKPSWIEVIGRGAFSDNSNLNPIILPDNINHTNITYNDGVVEYSHGDEFINFDRTLTANLAPHELQPSELLVDDEGKIISCSYNFENKKIIIPQKGLGFQGEQKDITGISDHNNIFTQRGLTSVTFPTSLTTIGNYAFGYNKLNNLDLSVLTYLTDVGDLAFYGNDLTSVTFPTSLTTIGNFAFSRNSSLTEIKLPTNSNEGFTVYLDSEGEEYAPGDDFKVFSRSIAISIGCHKLTANELTIDEYGVITGCDYNFKNKCIIIPDEINGQTITGIADKTSHLHGVFANKGLSTVTFSENSELTTIGDYAFSNNDKMTTVTFPASLAKIGNHAFFNNNLTSVIFATPSRIEDIGISAFEGNNGLTIVLPENSNEGFEGYFEEDYEGNVEKRNAGFEFYAFSSRIYADIPYTLTKEDVGVDENGIITQCKNESLPNRIIIPETIDGQTILGIVNADYNLGVFEKKSLISVSFPADLKTIGRRVFFDNNIKSLTFPSSLTTIGEGAFKGNLLTQVTFEVGEKGSSIVRIGKDAFLYNRSLTSIELPKNSNEGFEEYIEENDMGYVVIRNAGYEFDAFSSRIYAVPYTLTKEDVGVDENGIITQCKNESLPNRIIIPETIDGQTILGIVNADYNLGVFEKKSLISVSFSADLKTIGRRVFFDNNIKSLTFPSSLTTIGEGAFKGNLLTQVTFEVGEKGSSIVRIGKDAFLYNRSLTSIELPENSNEGFEEYIEENDMGYVVIRNAGYEFDTFSSRIYAVPYTLTKEDVEVDENGIITKCTKEFLPYRIIIPETIDGQTILGIVNADYNLGVFEKKSLISVTFPADLKTIGRRVFFDNNIKSLTFPSSLTTIGEGAFKGNLLTQVTFEVGEKRSSIVRIGKDAFLYNRSLTSIELPENSNGGFIGYVDDYGNEYDSGEDFTEFGRSLSIDTDCHEFTDGELAIVNGVIIACSYNFANKCIIIPEQIDIYGETITITGIADGVFQSEGLTSVTFPSNSSLTTIGDWAFNDNALASLDLPDGLTSLGMGAFFGNSLTYLDFPAGLTTIGGAAFYGNEIESVTFPNSLTNIGHGAFYGNKLDNLDLSVLADLTTIEASTFRNNSLTSVTFPASLTTIGDLAFSSNKLEEVKFELDENSKSSIQSIGRFAFDGNPDDLTITLPGTGWSIVGESTPLPTPAKIIDYDVAYARIETSSSRLASYASHSDVEILEQPQPFTYYPNPVVSQLTITANVGDRILMLNQVGVTVYDKVVTSVAHQIDVTDFPRGVYLIRLISAEGSVITKKLAKH